MTQSHTSELSTNIFTNYKCVNLYYRITLSGGRSQNRCTISAHMFTIPTNVVSSWGGEWKNLAQYNVVKLQ